MRAKGSLKTDRTTPGSEQHSCSVLGTRQFSEKSKPLNTSSLLFVIHDHFRGALLASLQVSRSRKSL